MERKALAEFRVFAEDRFTKRIVHQKGDSVVFVLNFAPGQELPTHKHPGTAVYLLVLEGSGTVTVDGTDTVVTAHDAIWVDGEEQFSFRNTGEGQTSLYVVLAKIPGEQYAKNV